MKTILHKSNTRGFANHGWLKSHHTFSFASYQNAERMNFGALRVLNDDVVQPKMGFGTHPHQNMEIISIPLQGALSHKDSMGNKRAIEVGEVQVMSAGSGIVHSEYNRAKEPLTLFQIWIETNKLNVKPRWETKKFPTQQKLKLTLLASGYKEDENDALFINQHARIYAGKLAKGAIIDHDIINQAYVLASDGMFKLEDNTNNLTMNKGDGAEITQAK